MRKRRNGWQICSREWPGGDGRWLGMAWFLAVFDPFNIAKHGHCTAWPAMARFGGGWRVVADCLAPPSRVDRVPSIICNRAGRAASACETVASSLRLLPRLNLSPGEGTFRLDHLASAELIGTHPEDEWH